MLLHFHRTESDIATDDGIHPTNRQEVARYKYGNRETTKMADSRTGGGTGTGRRAADLLRRWGTLAKARAERHHWRQILL
mmetsp:Transcript_38090/g.88637  ORF Transcript_38090/g.88637 Transcript_38090/m.88637 type:complete len:80 (-) Transcript_38090:9-248(-)